MLRYLVAPSGLVAALFALLLTACGGGGHGYAVQLDPLTVMSTSLPPLASGEQIDYPIELSGGCGGPYVMNVIEGQMPHGVSLDPATHSLQGYLLEDGSFTFKIQISDTGCTPFQTTTADFEMTVGVGSLTVVQALLDGVPSLIRPGDPNYDTSIYGQEGDYPAIPAVVYGDFETIVLQVAGGVPPYAAVVLDDPNNPNDGPLPTGAVIPENSTSIVGAPAEVGPGGGPFLITVRVTDHVGQQTMFTFYWLIRTPPIIIATEGLSNGVCGTPYSETFFIVDGVPPFLHNFSATGPGVGVDFTQTAAPDLSGDIVYDPPNPPTVPDPGLLQRIDASWYPAPTDTAGGTFDYRANGFVTPPEGLRLDDEMGVLSGIPRRRGTFRVNYHVQSSLVPDNFGQHSWRTFEFSFAPAPTLVHDPAYTLEGAFSLNPPYATIPEAEQGKLYDPPDSASHGLQILASGGVPQDGVTDAPHVSQSVPDPSESAGNYKWQVNYDPDNNGGNNPIPGMEISESGVWRETDYDSDTPGSFLVRQAPQEIAFTATDAGLPVQQFATQKVNFSIGPDVLVLTKSTTSCNAYYYYGNWSMNDPNMHVMTITEHADGSYEGPNALVENDLPGTGNNRIEVPSTADSAPGTPTSLDTLLTGIDITRVAVNPTGWWDDTGGLNPLGARPFQHGDANRYEMYDCISYVYYYMNSSSSYNYGPVPDVTAVTLPKAPDVTEDKSMGIYAGGGKLYVFDGQYYFGVFIVRSDSRIYVPAAFRKGTYQSFGDNWTYGWTSNAGASNWTLNKIPEMTVSPDGRFAALKLRTKTNMDQYEKADSTDVVIFSLTGERLWNGETYKVIGSGASGTTSTGELLYASSLTLTDHYLYYIVGNGSSNGYLYSSYRDHFIYRYDLLGGASAGSLLTSGLSGWTNSSGSPMAVPFQKYDNTFRSSTYGGPDYDMVQMSAYNSHEQGHAPHPFRVSRDGSACVIVAGKNPGGAYGSDIFQYDVWIDQMGTLQKLSSTPRRILQAGGRGYSLHEGPMRDYIYQYGTWNGPTTQLEVSDDGTKVAAVYNTYTGTAYNGSGYPDYYMYPSYNYYSSSYWYLWRENVVAYTQSGGGSWSEVPVTASTFSGSDRWRFGSLVFTKDTDGLVFWAGFSQNSPAESYAYYYYGYYNASRCYSGSLYGYDFTQATPGVYSLLGSSDGGSTASVGTKYTSSSPYTGTTSSWSTAAGVIKPTGGFLSMNREFFYIVTHGALTSSGGPDFQLIGVNIRSVNTSSSVNGHTDFRAFHVSGMFSRGGFSPTYGSYYSTYGIGHYSTYDYYWYGSQGACMGSGLQVAATNTGVIYFATHYQIYGPYNYHSYYYGGPTNSTYYGDYGYYEGNVEVFDPNVGGSVQHLTYPSWSFQGSYSFRSIEYLEVSDDGTQVGFVYKISNYYYYEAIGFVGNVHLNASTGALQSGKFFVTLVSGYNRVCSAMTNYNLGPRFYAAVGSGGSSSTNENQKKLYEYKPDSSGGHGTDLQAGQARYNILNAGR